MKLFKTFLDEAKDWKSLPDNAWVLVQGNKVIKTFNKKPGNSAFTSSKDQELMTVKYAKKMMMEGTKWKKGDGRPRGGSSIENVRFWDLSDDELKYIMKDANAAMKANPEGKKAGKYADEVNDGSTVLFWRKKNKIKVEK